MTMWGNYHHSLYKLCQIVQTAYQNVLLKVGLAHENKTSNEKVEQLIRLRTPSRRRYYLLDRSRLSVMCHVVDILSVRQIRENDP